MSYEKIKAFNLRKDEASSAPWRPVFKSRLALELCSQDKLSWGGWPCRGGFFFSWVCLGGYGEGRWGSAQHQPGTHAHTKLLSVTTRCSISLGTRVEPSPRVGRARELPAAQTRTYFYTNTDLYFQFSKRLCFHLKRCCLLLFDLNQMKANRIQMKYVCVLILHRESLLRAARGCSRSGLGV